jgi:hypothetical protein
LVDWEHSGETNGRRVISGSCSLLFREALMRRQGATSGARAHPRVRARACSFAPFAMLRHYDQK